MGSVSVRHIGRRLDDFYLKSVELRINIRRNEMQLNLDLSGVNTLSSKVVVPTGNYSVEIERAEVKETKSKGGYYIELGYKILSGDHAGLVLTDRLNIVNSNEDAQRIGLSTLKTVATVGKHRNPNLISDTNELLGLKFNIYIEEVDSTFTTVDGKEIDTTENKFKSYYEYEEVKQQVSTPQPKLEMAPAPQPTVTPAPTPQVQQPSLSQGEAPAPLPTQAAAQFPWMK